MSDRMLHMPSNLYVEHKYKQEINEQALQAELLSGVEDGCCS